MARKIMLISPKDNNFYNFRSELILKLQKLGNEVVLVCPYGKKMDYFIERGCRFIDIEMDRRGTSVVNDLKLIFAYKKILEKEAPEIVLLYTSKPSIYAGYLCGKMKIPYVVNNAGLMDSTGLFDKFMKLLYWIGFRKASCIMFQNAQERDVIEKVLKNKVHYRDIPGSGVNLDEFPFTDYPINDDEVIFNYVGRIVALKGIDEYLECAARIKKEYPHTHFRIYGEYDDDKYKRKVESSVAEYCGVLLDMKPSIAAAHAVIHPSHYEGMTNVILEHGAMGRPCIGSNIPGVQDGIVDGKTGYVFKVKDVHSMVEAVKKFVELPYQEKRQYGINAHQKMVQEFNREIVTNIYLEEIDAICHENRIKGVN